MEKFQEIDNYILLNDMTELKNLQIFKNSQYGANSTIYNYKNNELLKVYNSSKSMYRLYETEKINKLETKTLLKMFKILFINEQFYGYSMPKIKGTMIAYLNTNVNLRDFLKSLSPVQEDLILLGNNGFSADDLNILNIIYNKKENKTTLIDLESYNFSIEESKEYKCLLNSTSLYYLILNTITKNYSYTQDNNFIKTLYKNIANITEIKHTPYDFFIKHINHLENKFDTPIENINDLRKILKKQ